VFANQNDGHELAEDVKSTPCAGDSESIHVELMKSMIGNDNLSGFLFSRDKSC
jgi:hypothetical protein